MEFINQETLEGSLMSGRLQQGIYYSEGNEPGNSFAVVFLRSTDQHHPAKIRNTLSALWNTYLKLQEGIIDGLNFDGNHLYSGNLSVLIGFGPKTFEIDGIKRTKPSYLAGQWLFREPTVGGGPILGDTGLKYADDVARNEIANDHFIIQFIGDSQLSTHRAVVETWKTLRKLERDTACAPVVMRSFHTGFSRPDKRSWLGFHDGISNIESSERTSAITIGKEKADPAEYWTINGTYMAYIRMAIDLSAWEAIPVKQQERLVGRVKSTGCPIIGIDENDRNIPVMGCPVEGTYEITDDRNKSFRSYPEENCNSNSTNMILEDSHVGRMLKAYGKDGKRTASDLIFRQGYEFLEPAERYPYFCAGLNFVSFQSDTERLYRILQYGLGRANFGGDPENPIPGSARMLLVRGCGLFFVPPNNEGQAFPGEDIFLKDTQNENDYENQPIRFM